MNTQIIRFLFGTTIALAIVLALLILPMPTPARAVSSVPASSYSIGVTTTTDEYDVTLNSTCSLREAVKTANNAADFGGCTRVIGDGSGADTILLPSGTYTLTLAGAGEDFDATGDLDIINSMIISATGALSPTVTANPGWDDRIFHVLTGTVNVTMKGMIISGGSVSSGAGGAVRIESGASLTINDSEVSHNSSATLGGGIYNLGAATLNNVSLNGNIASTGDGGGIDNLSVLTLTNVTLSGNSASGDGGGGISNVGTAMLTNVTLSGNSALLGGGFANDGPATLTNVTFSGNSASDGGGIFNLRDLTITNVTLSGNFTTGGSGGGVKNGGTVTLTNTIVANSPSGGNCSPSLSGSFNLSSDSTCGFGAGRDNINVMLAPLGNYGGPTLTHMLKPGSPAIDFGTNTGCPSDDQRGKSRPVNGTCDVGAVERQPVDFSYWLNLPLILR